MTKNNTELHLNIILSSCFVMKCRNKHWILTAVIVFATSRMDKDSSMTVDWGEFLQHVILNPADNIRELVSSWKHSLVRMARIVTSHVKWTMMMKTLTLVRSI